jgi:23S rRNA G2445 N2-methylase RlmL
VERLAFGRTGAGAAVTSRALGIDLDARVLACALENLQAAGFARRADLILADARALPLPDGSVDALAADLPFGHLMGSHAENVAAYPLILREAARVARPGARFGLITHEVRLMEQLLAQEGFPWHAEQVLRVELGGLFPRIFVLIR